MFRFLRFALAFFMVPVVIFTTPTTATAAAGPWKNATVKAENPVTGTLDVTCQITLRQSGVAEIPGIQIGTNGYCVGGPDITPGQAQAGEAGAAYVISVDGLTAANVPCNGSLSGVMGPHPANGTVRVAGSLVSGFIYISEPCSIQRVGIRFDGTNSDQFTWQGVDVPLVEDTGPVATACTWGTPRLENVEVFIYSEGSQSYNYRMRADLVIQNEQAPGRMWGVYGYYVNPSTGLLITKSQTGTRVDRLNASTVTFEFIDTKSQLKSLAPPEPWLVGFEINAAFDGWNNNNTVAHSLSAAMATVYPPGAFDNYGGWTDPEHCRFWVGDKVHDVAGTDGDEPSSAVNGVPPTEDPEPVTEEPEPITDPPVDLGWLALIWGVLKSILGVITSLATSIITGIINGLKGLLIPDTDNWGVADLVDQLKLKPPFSLFAELEDEARSLGLSYRAGGSCGVIGDFGNGGVLSCSSIASVPGFSALYSLVSAGLMGLTGWGMFLMVSRLFEDGQ